MASLSDGDGDRAEVLDRGEVGGVSKAPPATEADASPAVRAVARYYDATTRLFLRADTAQTSTIHRRLWAPGVRDAREAAEHVHHVLAERIGDGAREVLDLGCGVGATCLWLAERLGVTTTGITVSPVQHALAEGSARRRGLDAQCRFLLGDFMRLHAVVAEGSFDAAYAIESFLHAPEAAGFFAEASRALRPGGRLFVCDDFLTKAAPQEARAIARFKRGWHVSTLLTAAATAAAAASAGLRLTEDLDFTPYLRLQPRFLLGALAVVGDALGSVPGLGSSGFVDNWLGGTGLQQCQQEGWSSYRLLCFEKR